MNFGMNTKFHHVGIATQNIKNLNIPTSEITLDPTQNVRVAFANIHGCPVEFIEPVNQSSPVIESLKTHRPLMHICFEVASIEETLEIAKKNRCTIIQKPTPAAAFNQRPIAWIYHRDLGLIELLEQ